MQRTIAMVGLLVGLATSAQAQKAWQTEIGLQGGFTRAVQAGSGGSPTDVISFPGFNLGPALPLASGVYAIIPWKDKIAVDVDLGVSQLTGSLTATLAQLGLRADYAVTPRIYASAGGAVGYIDNSGTVETQLGLQGALGYRHRLSGPLNARVEFRATFWGKAEHVGAIDTYSLLLGVSTATRRGAPAPARRAVTNSAWTPQLGFFAGYANIHAPGTATGDITVLAFPGFGGGLGAIGGAALSTPPTLWAILPIGRKIALEPGVDLHRTQLGGTTSFLGNFSARFDYAVHGGWYGALGGNLHYVKTTATSGTSAGLNLGWGYRFGLMGPLGGRVEANYTMFGKSTKLAAPPVNVFGLMIGASMPLH